MSRGQNSVTELAGTVCEPDHLLRLPGEPWGLWRWVCLRSAGFPVSDVLRLAAPACATAADRALAAEDTAQRLCQRALEEVRAEIETAPRPRRKSLVKAIRRLRKGQPPRPLEAAPLEAAPLEAAPLEAAPLEAAPLETVPDAAAAVAAFTFAHQRAVSARAAYNDAFTAAQQELSYTIRRIGRGERFREAILWQNRTALKTGVEALLRHPPDASRRASKERQHEQLVASYLQRFCTKNDTIGFFGPVGWARFVERGEAVIARPGSTLLKKRKVFYEGWCVDAIAESLARSEALKPWLAPRRKPFLRLEGHVLHRLHAAPLPLSQDQLALLLVCDGERSAKQLAIDFVRRPDAGPHSLAEVYSLLEELRDLDLVSWTLEIPLSLEPERDLYRLLGRIEDESLRRETCRKVADIDTARAAVAAAAGDLDRLDHAFEDLERRFRSLTRTAATRAHGKTYAGRTLVYEDTCRDIEVELGPDIREALAPPLGLLLTGARWLSYAVARGYRKAFRGIYSKLGAERGSASIDLASFCRRAAPILVGSGFVTKTLLPAAQKRWADLLSIPSGGRRLVFSSRELAPRVRRAFRAPRPGWRLARYQCPDLLIAAPNCDAIRRAEHQFVLGEVHLAVNTLATALFVAQHPCPEELLQAQEHDLGEPCVVPLRPKLWRPKRVNPNLGIAMPRTTARLEFGLISPRDLRLELAADPGGASAPGTLEPENMVVEPAGEDLVVRRRGGEERFDILDFFQFALSNHTVNAFKILPPRPHTPRITIDQLVVCRETWRFAAVELDFSGLGSEQDRFLASRRWSREHGMPRFVFVKTPTEIKPFFLDFDSPVSVEIFAKAVRATRAKSPRNATIAISEMLPEPDRSWLPDAEGRHYTSELRIVAVDLSADAERRFVRR